MKVVVYTTEGIQVYDNIDGIKEPGFGLNDGDYYLVPFGKYSSDDEIVLSNVIKLEVL
jgi:hypothetical protein